jgi:uncharacterized protein YqhQ
MKDQNRRLDITGCPVKDMGGQAVMEGVMTTMAEITICITRAVIYRPWYPLKFCQTHLKVNIRHTFLSRR